MNELLTTIKEVQEGGKNLANWYLDHGYVLLDIQPAARGQRFPTETGPNAGQWYVRRNPVYVVGRPEGVEAADSPPRWAPQPPKEEPAS